MEEALEQEEIRNEEDNKEQENENINEEPKEEKKSKKILFKLTEELFNEFSDFCETHYTTKSEVIRKLITNYLNEKE